MFIQNDETVVVSASDLIQSAKCEFAFMRILDHKLGRGVEIPEVVDEMLARAGKLGDEHEAKQLRKYITDFGADEVTVIKRPEGVAKQQLLQREKETLAALKAKQKVVFQATFFEQNFYPQNSLNEPRIAFLGYADFIVKKSLPDGSTTWQVEDTKLARSPKPAALMQIAAYAKQLKRLGVNVHDEGVIILGDGTRSKHKLDEVYPVYNSRVNRMLELISDGWNRNTSLEWAEIIAEQKYQSCGVCEVCEPWVEQYRDPRLIAGIRGAQRDKLFAAGLETIDDVAAAFTAVKNGEFKIKGMSLAALQKITAQARAQLQTEKRGDGKPVWELFDARALTMIPPKNDGDIFFDFEGDPLFHDVLESGQEVWNIDYLFGLVDKNEHFTAFWAHNLTEEKKALIDFIDFVQTRRKKFPDMHIYHYAPYEKTHLKSLAARHGVCEEEVDDLLRNDVLVDLYWVVKNAFVVGSRSYSIKKLEPLYMGEMFRAEDGVVSGAESVSEYANAMELLNSQSSVDIKEAKKRLAAIADYNKYDCVSTLRLRDWLLEIAAENTVQPAALDFEMRKQKEPKPEEEERSELAQQLLQKAEQAKQHGSLDERNVYALAASAIDYHKREHKSFWWEHFDRLIAPFDEWADTRDVFTVVGQPKLILDWGKPPRARKLQRRYELPGSFAPGSSVKEGTQAYAIYDPAANGPVPGSAGNRKVPWKVTINEVLNTGLIVTEYTNDSGAEWSDFPFALTPGEPPHPGSQVEAIAWWGEQLLATDKLPQDPVVDIIVKEEPQFVSDKTLIDFKATKDGPKVTTISAVISALKDLHNSVIAVQGPPGTGKTFLASHVIKQLVTENSWRIGVTAQSHKVIENVLNATVNAGLSNRLVVKDPQRGTKSEEQLFTPIAGNKLAEFIAQQNQKREGFVVGGTAWLFSNEGRIPRKELDLLVIDEAGQFSLAPTIAATVAAKRLLLLGDPQQLPQVSQGTHPEPVNESALGWFLGAEETIPDNKGFFLAQTWRMRPELTKFVSALAYENKLSANPAAENRSVIAAGSPGIKWHPVSHIGNTTTSIEEATVVLKLTKQFLQAKHTNQNQEPIPVTAADIIVVAPYNAQVETINQVFEEAGIEGVRVGTVDKFQGQEALIAIVSLAASRPEDVPRGLDFLLMRNRLNVAISRAKWSAHIVSSTALGGRGIPGNLAEMKALSGYLSLTEEQTR